MGRYSATRKSEVTSQKSEVYYNRFSAFSYVLTLLRSAIGRILAISRFC
ncbi:MAG: hypothetical protein F6K26_48920 [Moorea sp. SIO2I5]|nr:hypothetical protein [Moorena sp. SIO2I5]